MEGMGLKFTPMIGRHLLCYLSMFGPMIDTSGLTKGLTCLWLSTHPSICLTLLQHAHPYNVPSMILQ